MFGFCDDGILLKDLKWETGVFQKKRNKRVASETEEKERQSKKPIEDKSLDT